MNLHWRKRLSFFLRLVSTQASFVGMGKADVFFQGHQAMAIRLGVDLKLFDAIANRSSEQEGGRVTVSQIAKVVKADPKLVGMFTRLNTKTFTDLN